MTVYLVGAGPGDPGLLTRRAAELLGRATTVVHDRLVEPGVLALAGSSARLVDVGKRGDGGPSASQADINALLVRAGRTEAVVVRLKGGDPFVLGRGGEEALALEAAGVAYEVVPGVSAAFAAAAAAGVPVTHRLVASSVAVLSGHTLEAAGEAERDWSLLGGSSATLVVLMGAAGRAQVAERLLAAGRPADTPVVVVERATTPGQATTRTTLGHLAEVPAASPATIVVGAVAGLRLASYEDRPLAGRTVVVTRAPEQSAGLVAALEAAGAAVVALPTRATAPPVDGGAGLRAAAAGLGGAAWVVLASPNAVEALFGAVRDARDLAGVQVAAVGPGTAAALAARGVAADLVAEPGAGRSASAALLDRFPSCASPGTGRSRVVLPRAAGGREELAEGLRRLGWDVEVVDAYRSVVPPADPDVLGRLGEADAVCFASPSALEGFLEVVGRDRLPAVVVTIGPTTSAAAARRGVAVAAEASAPDADGIVAALQAALGGHGP